MPLSREVQSGSWSPLHHNADIIPRVHCYLREDPADDGSVLNDVEDHALLRGALGQIERVDHLMMVWIHCVDRDINMSLVPPVRRMAGNRQSSKGPLITSHSYRVPITIMGAR